MNKLHKYLMNKFNFYKTWHDNNQYEKINWGIFVGFSVLLVVLLTANINGKNEKILASTNPSRPFRMSFTTFPAGIANPATTTYSDTDAIYNFIGQNADMITFHFGGGVPWVEAYNNQPYSQNLMDDWNLKKSKAPANMPVYVAISPTNLSKNALAPYWGSQNSQMALPADWATYRFNDPHVKTAYLNFAKSVVDFFQPKYLAICIECNGLILNSHAYANTNWSDFLELNQYVYSQLKQLYPNLVIFSTIQYEDLKKYTFEQPEVTNLMQNSDILGLSTYHYGTGNNPITSDYFNIALYYNKPIAIAESGAMSDSVAIGSTTYSGNLDDQNQFVSYLLQQATQNNFLFVVNFVSIDYDKWLSQIGNIDFAKFWVHTGFEDANYAAKPVLASWNSYLSNSYAPSNIAITAPVNNKIVFGSAVTIKAATIGPISKVEFYVDGTLLSTATGTPYSTKWNTTGYANATYHTLTAKSYDQNNVVNTSNAVTAIVADITPPFVSITAPQDNSRVQRNTTVDIKATSTDLSPISKVEFYVNNVLTCTSIVTPYTCAWRVPNQSRVTYSLQAKSYDPNTVGTSTVITVISK